MSETSMAKKQPHTMYDPSFEKDACGMGFIANRHGESSHQLVDYALTMLERMNHRGGTGAEPDTGDGAGILMAIPDSFFQKDSYHCLVFSCCLLLKYVVK